MTDKMARPAQVRIARPSHDVAAAKAFYCDGLGAVFLGDFVDHDGFSGLMVGLPDRGVHIEFVTGPAGSEAPRPTGEDALVLYYPVAAEHERAVARMTEAGYRPVTPDNPYWSRCATCFRDPDGYTLILARTGGLR